jgi:hypothetical protein
MASGAAARRAHPTLRLADPSLANSRPRVSATRTEALPAAGCRRGLGRRRRRIGSGRCGAAPGSRQSRAGLQLLQHGSHGGAKTVGLVGQDSSFAGRRRRYRHQCEAGNLLIALTRRFHGEDYRERVAVRTAHDAGDLRARPEAAMGVLQHLAQCTLQRVLGRHLRIGDGAAARIVDYRNAIIRLRPGGLGPSNESSHQHQREQTHAGVPSRFAVESIAKPRSAEHLDRTRPGRAGLGAIG